MLTAGQRTGRWRQAWTAVLALVGLTVAGCSDSPAGGGAGPAPAAVQSTAAATGGAGSSAAKAAGGGGETSAPGGAAAPVSPAAASTPPAPLERPSAAATSNPKGIFAVSAIYTIRPDGTVAERADGRFGALAQKNNAFDGDSNTIHLYGIQNQEVGVQIVIPFSGKDFGAQAAKFDGIPAENITFSWIAYDAVIKTDKASNKPLPAVYLPDVIVPLNGSINGIKTFNVPQELAGLPTVAAKQGLLLMEVWIPKALAAGTHAGSITLREGDVTAAVLNVEVHVQAVMLPDRPTFRMDYLNYASPLKNFGLDAALGDGATTDMQTTAAAIRVEQSIYALTLDNRGFLNVLPYASQRGRGEYGFPIEGSGAAAKVKSFAGFDARYDALLSGKLGKYQVAPACFTLPFNINYPYTSQSDTAKHFDFRPFHKNIPEGPGKNDKLKVWEDTNRAVGQQVLAHFAEKGWKHTAFELYHNQKPADNNRSPWKLDEPVEAADYQGLRYLLNTGKWAFEGAAEKGVQVVTRVDIGHWECDRLKTLDGKLTKDYKSKEFNTANAAKVLKPVVDRWVAGYTHVQGAQWLIPEYNTAKVWFDTYGGAGESISHGGVFVGTGWICNGIGVEGKVIYKTTFAPPTQVVDDTTMYSAKGLGAEAALCSRRLKLWRDGVNDYDVLELAKRKDPAAAQALLSAVLKVGPASNDRYREDSKTIETYFTNNVEDVATAERIAAGIAAGDAAEAGLKLEGFSKAYSGCGAPDTIVGYD